MSRPIAWNSGSRPVAAIAMLQNQIDRQTHARSVKAPQQQHEEHNLCRELRCKLRDAWIRATDITNATPSHITAMPQRRSATPEASAARSGCARAATAPLTGEPRGGAASRGDTCSARGYPSMYYMVLHGVCGPKRTAPPPPCAAALLGAACIPHGSCKALAYVDTHGYRTAETTNRNSANDRPV